MSGCGDRNRGARSGDSLEMEMRWRWVDKSSRPHPFIDERGGEKWGVWAGSAHGRAERGCVECTRLPRTAARLAAGRVEADDSSGMKGTWRGRLVQGSCLHMLVLSDVAVRLCNSGHVADGAGGLRHDEEELGGARGS
jgi:hypothetical protein